MKKAGAVSTRPAKLFTLGRIESLKIPTKNRPDGQAEAVLKSRDLRPSEIPAARRAHALHRAFPWIPTIEIATRLARDHGLYDRRWRPYRCKRLRRLIAAYAECVHAGVEPAPETIFSNDEAG
jgi:hypothetical protein